MTGSDPQPDEPEVSLDFSRFDVLMFDCYGTLIDWETGILDALAPVRDRFGIELGDEAVLTAFGRAEAQCEDTNPGASYPAILEGVFHALAETWDIPPQQEMAQAFAASVGDWPAFGDSLKALKVLSHDFDLAILSNVDRASFAKTQKKHLNVDFAHVMTAEEIGSYKPDPNNFAFALQRFEEHGIARDRVLHVAQSLYHDHVPAKAAGLTTCFVDRRAGRSGSGATKPPEVSVTPDVIVESMAELAALLRSR